ncbi:hypothetical protein PMAYCL1PPCAC_20492, partial [Pristionchus mayeri]
LLVSVHEASWFVLDVVLLQNPIDVVDDVLVELMLTRSNLSHCVPSNERPVSNSREDEGEHETRRFGHFLHHFVETQYVVHQW